MAILPISMIGLLFGIGVLGFAPFLTTFVYARNGWRAYMKSVDGKSSSSRFSLMLLGLFVLLGTPGLVNAYVNRQIRSGTELLLSGDPAKELNGMKILRGHGMFTNFESIVRAYEREKDEMRRQQIGEWYQQLTGNDAERILARWND